MGWKPNIFKHFNWKSHNRLSLLDFVESLLTLVHSSCQGLMLTSHLNLCLPLCPEIFYFSSIQENISTPQRSESMISTVSSLALLPCLCAPLPHPTAESQWTCSLGSPSIYPVPKIAVLCCMLFNAWKQLPPLFLIIFFIAANGTRANLALFTLVMAFMRVDLMGHMIILCLTFWEIARLFSIVATPFYIPTIVHMGSSFSISLPTFVICLFLKFLL